MDDLVGWLRAQLDEDERVARATIRPDRAGAWIFVRDESEGPSGVMVSSWAIEFDDIAPALTDRGTLMGPSTMRHIARHDPARVLAEVDAKRRIIAEHELALAERKAHPKDLANVGLWLGTIRVLKLLALPYADRPGFLEGWRP
jgi:hypothetical protein